MKHLTALLTILLLLSSCSKDDNSAAPETPDGPARRTVIVYMAAENNLSSMAEYNLRAMIAGRKLAAKDENLVVYVDRLSKTELPFIAKVTTDERNPLDTLYKYPSDSYASDPSVMRDVLQRAIQLCPATEDYGLVLWGHANGWIIETDSVASSFKAPRHAFGIDSGDNELHTKNDGTLEGQWINIPSIRKVLEQVGIKWKYVFTDCCCMLNIETAYELRNQVEYLSGSPAEITGSGAPYGSVVKDFFIHNDTEMYKALCDDCYAQLDAANGHAPMAVIKTANTPALAKATRQVLTRVNDFLKTPDATSGMIYYYAYDRNKESEKTLYDMNDVIQTALKDDVVSYQNWKDVFKQTVVYSRSSTYWHADAIYFADFTEAKDNVIVFKHGNDCCGVTSMFFPMEKYSKVSHKYNETIRQTGWYYAVGWSEVGW